MIITDEINRGKLQSIIVGELKKAGLKHRLKKIILKNIKDNKTVFGAALNKIPSCSVVCCKSTLSVPIVVTEMAAVLRSNSHVEGLFRKAGSQTRQRDIKRLVEAGGMVSAGHHPVDVAGVLKGFLRALPEPLIPPDVQELLLRCHVPNAEGSESVFHTLLLLPVLHVHLLHYVCELLHYIASQHQQNRMDAGNLAIVLAPSVMPLPAAATAQRVQRHVALVQLLIERARSVGVLTAGLRARLCVGDTPGEGSRGGHEGEVAARRHKRRSGSLNRVLSGLRRMVAGGASGATATPAGGATPALRGAKPARGGLSARAREEIKSSLPQKELIFTPMKMGQSERKRLRLSMMETSEVGDSPAVDLSPVSTETEQYVRVPRSEYEDIKTRVSAIERRLSQDLPSDPDSPPRGVAQVQRAYTHTLQSAAALQRRYSRDHPPAARRPAHRSPSARKIGSIRRRSQENQPKLGRNHSCNIRLSAANERALPDVLVPAAVSPATTDYRYPLRTRNSLGATPDLDRSRYSLISTGDSRPSLDTTTGGGRHSLNAISTIGSRRSLNATTTMDSRRSLLVTSTVDSQQSLNATSDMSWEPSPAPAPPTEKPVTWRNAATFFMERTGEVATSGGDGGRPSVNRLRRANAGAVRAKTRMFESGSDRSSERSEPRPVLARRPAPRTKPDVERWRAARKPPTPMRALPLSPRRRSPRLPPT